MKKAIGILVVLELLVAALPRGSMAQATPTPLFNMANTPPAGEALPMPTTAVGLVTMKNLQGLWRMVDHEDTLFFKEKQRLSITSPMVSLEAYYTVNNGGELEIQMGLPSVPRVVRTVKFPDGDTLSLTDVKNGNLTIEYKRVK